MENKKYQEEYEKTRRKFLEMFQKQNTPEGYAAMNDLFRDKATKIKEVIFLEIGLHPMQAIVFLEEIANNIKCKLFESYSNIDEEIINKNDVLNIKNRESLN